MFINCSLKRCPTCGSVSNKRPKCAVCRPTRSYKQFAITELWLMYKRFIVNFQTNTEYTGYTADDEVIKNFWHCMESLPENHRVALLQVRYLEQGLILSNSYTATT